MSKQVKYQNHEDGKVLEFNDVDLSLTYSYSNYLNWLFDDRVELIKGKVFKMSPAPSRLHQEISRNLFLPIASFLKDQPCKAYTAPFDVRFPQGSKADDAIYTVLQPDICVICDQSKLDDKGCIGAPDLVIEILSPGNNKKELLYKYQIYQEFGVKEYWVVSQSDQTVLIYSLNELGKYEPSKIFTLSEVITSKVLIGFILNLDEVFKDL